MRKIGFFDTLGNITTDFLLLLTGVLFLTNRYTGWTILYILTILLCAVLPVRLLLNIRAGIRTANTGTILLVVFDIVFLVTIVTQPDTFTRWFHVFFGWWMFGHGLLSLIEFYVLIHDQLPGAVPRFFTGIVFMILAVLMILGRNLSIKTDVLSFIAGLFFLVYGILGILFHIAMIRRETQPGLSAWSYSPPVLLNAFFPLALFISLRQLQKSSRLPVKDGDDEADLNVFIHMKGKGPEAFGHIDLSYKGTLLSYGNHDPASRRLGGTYGDGVLFRVGESEFIRHTLNVEGKTVIGYGIRLSDVQKEALEGRIRELFSRTVPWECAACIAEKSGGDMSKCIDYASRVYKSTHCEMFKFSKGRFRTYFISSTNCVMLADELLRSKNLRLLNLSGIVTPGAYLSFLNTEYLKPNSAVVSRTLYETVPASPMSLKEKQL